MLLTACMMLDHLNEDRAAARIRKAIDTVLREGRCVTRDLGGTAGTRQYTDALIQALPPA
jgi:isocitrate/isopropylmalate dehydrogenase